MREIKIKIPDNIGDIFDPFRIRKNIRNTIDTPLILVAIQNTMTELLEETRKTNQNMKELIKLLKGLRRDLYGVNRGDNIESGEEVGEEIPSSGPEDDKY